MAAYRDKRSGRWRYRKWIMLPCGRRERITGTPPIDSKKAALEAEEMHARRFISPGMVQVQPVEPRPAETRKEVPTFQEFVEERWLPTYPAAAGNRARTIAEKEWHVKHHLMPHLAERPLDGIRGEVLDRLFAKLHKKLSPKSVKNVRATLGTILRSAKRWDVIAEVPEMPG